MNLKQYTLNKPLFKHTNEIKILLLIANNITLVRVTSINYWNAKNRKGIFIAPKISDKN